MVKTIAVAGKGGTGKTTLCGLLINDLIRRGVNPILAVDADANSNLNEVLGVKAEMTLADIREEIAKAEIADPSPIPPGMSKSEYADMRFVRALHEEDDFDLLIMGRGQSKGCYCYVNDILRAQIQRYYKNYACMVCDNEAGLEHISRGILPPVDIILLVSDCSRRGVETAGRVSRMIGELRLDVKKTCLIVNRAPCGILADGIKSEIAAQNLELLCVVPDDASIYEFDAAGKPTVNIAEDSPAKIAVSKIVDALASMDIR